MVKNSETTGFHPESNNSKAPRQGVVVHTQFGSERHLHVNGTTFRVSWWAELLHILVCDGAQRRAVVAEIGVIKKRQKKQDHGQKYGCEYLRNTTESIIDEPGKSSKEAEQAAAAGHRKTECLFGTFWCDN